MYSRKAKVTKLTKKRKKLHTKYSQTTRKLLTKIMMIVMTLFLNRKQKQNLLRSQVIINVDIAHIQQLIKTILNDITISA